MPTSSRRDGRLHAFRELVVPVILITCIGLYIFDSFRLSASALALPTVLILVILAALLYQFTQALIENTGASSGSAPGADQDETTGPILAIRPWLIVGLPAVAVFLFDYLGVLASLLALVFGAQIALSSKSPTRSLLITLAVTLPTYYMFKYVLYARFSSGMFGIG